MIKDIFWRFKRFWHDQISTRLFPRNRWLTSIIPRTYQDKDFLIEIVILKCIVEYVDNEIGGIEHLYSKEKEETAHYPEHQAKFEIELKEIYFQVTKTLPELIEKLENEWKNVPTFSIDDLNKPRDYQTTYGKIDELEKEIDDLKTKIMVWAISNRESMWT